MYKSFFLKSVLALSVLSLLTSCSDDDNNAANVSLETKTFSNLYAPQTGGQGQPVGGAFTKFSFSQNATVTDDSWDIAFRGTTIIVNGGSAIGITDEPTRTGNGAVSIVTNTLDAVTTIPDVSSFAQDATNTYALGSNPDTGGKQWADVWVNNIVSDNINSTTENPNKLKDDIIVETTEILRIFKDFTDHYIRTLTDDEKKNVEDWVNDKIKKVYL